ncbi:MAG: hypothetical protein ACOCXK_00840 [Rhodosalinus sp.]
MTGQFRNAVMLALSLGMSAPASVVWAEDFIKIDGVAGASIDLPIVKFPGDHFTPAQMRNFESSRIVTAGDLIAADPAVVGRILGVSARQARMTQRHLKEALGTRR